MRSYAAAPPWLQHVTSPPPVRVQNAPDEETSSATWSNRGTLRADSARLPGWVPGNGWTEPQQRSVPSRSRTQPFPLLTATCSTPCKIGSRSCVSGRPPSSGSARTGVRLRGVATQPADAERAHRVVAPAAHRSVVEDGARLPKSHRHVADPPRRAHPGAAVRAPSRPEPTTARDRARAAAAARGVALASVRRGPAPDEQHERQALHPRLVYFPRSCGCSFS